jgi:hypothetical protein
LKLRSWQLPEKNVEGIPVKEDVTVGIREIREMIRRWIDGDINDDPLGNINASASQRREAEEFIAQVARQVDEVMKRETFKTPKGTVNIPPQFIVFLSAELDKQWKATTKRQALRHALTEIVVERAAEARGGTSSGPEPSIDLRPDATLDNPNSFRVQALWDETGEDTVFMPEEIKETIFDPSLGAEELYTVEVSREGARPDVISVTKSEITIGRGARGTPVDLLVAGDPNISRIQAILRQTGRGTFSLTSVGLNPTVVDGQRLEKDKPVRIRPGQKIKMSSYTFSIKTKTGGKPSAPSKKAAKKRSPSRGR